MDDRATGFGAQLRRYRVGAGLTQEALAERAGLAASAVAALERGRRRRPQPHTVRQLAAALQLDAAQRTRFEAAARPLEAPPAPPAPPPLGNLPAPRTALIGREQEVDAVVDLVAQGEARLVTLTGEGGVGKTRVALQAAALLRDRGGAAGVPDGWPDGAPDGWPFPDGVWLVELAPLADPALVPHAVAATLGVREAPGAARLEGLVDALRARSLLLVLDNCEHLLDACARLAERLLDACPGLCLLATGREPLRIAGEQQRRVPPLPVPGPGTPRAPDALARNPAVRLFVERAQAAAPAFRLTAANAAAVAGVCVRLDGLPLALELAAARVPVLTVEQIRARLDGSLRLLTGGSRAGPGRQQTLRATLEWGHALLDPPERAAFRRLAPFAGGFDLPAAEAVCAGAGLAGADVLDVLGRLVAKSLVVAEVGGGGGGGDEARYRLLETVRQDAAERLEASGEAPVVRGRHRDWCLALVEGAAPHLQGPWQAAWLARLEAEHDNLRAALRWSVERGEAEPGLRMAAVLGAVGARGGLWYLHGHWSEGQTWLEALLALPGAAPRSALRARALAWAGNLAAFRGDDAAAQALAAQALATFRERGDRLGVAEALYVLSTPMWWQGDFAAARAALAESLAAFRESGDRQMASITLSVLVHLAFAAGELAAARALSEEALAAQRELGHTVGLQFSLHNLGEVAQAEGDLAAARARFAESLRVYLRTGSKVRLATVLEGFAALAAAQGQPARALRLAGAAAALREATGARRLPPRQSKLERRLQPAPEALGREAQAAAWAEGRALPLEHAVADARALAAGEAHGPGSLLPLEPRPPQRHRLSRPPRPPWRHRGPRLGPAGPA